MKYRSVSEYWKAGGELNSFTATAHDDHLDASHCLKVSVKFSWWVRPLMRVAIWCHYVVQKYGTKVKVDIDK